MAEGKQAAAWSEGVRRLGLAAVQLRAAGRAFQAWEAEREGQGRGHISGAIDTMLGGIEQTVDSLADHLVAMADGEYKEGPARSLGIASEAAKAFAVRVRQAEVDRFDDDDEVPPKANRRG